MATTTAVMEDRKTIKIEDSPEPVSSTPTQANTNPSSTARHFDPKDPECFLRRCAGYNKKKGVRCSAVIGRNSQYSKNSHATFLPTCHAHKDQQSYAGWCQFQQQDGERCGRLFRWTPPYLELCAEHQGHPDTPCYFTKLPLELRLEIFRYLLPSKAIGSSTSPLHTEEEQDQQQQCHHSQGIPNGRYRGPGRPPVFQVNRSHSLLNQSTTRSAFSVPLLNLLLISRQIHDEVKDFLYSTVPFTVDVRKDGTFMCGRRLLEPRRADGTSHYVAGDVDNVKEKFLKTFDWAAVKNYNVDILVENWRDDTNHGYHVFPWDEEVEIYDIRDYIGVVVSGILSKARDLCKLNVRLCFSKFLWDEEETQANIETLVGPFERLRNVRQPRFVGVYEGTPQRNCMISLPEPYQAPGLVPSGWNPPRPSTPLCSVPQLPAKVSLFACNQPRFIKYRTSWERWIASPSVTSLVCKPPIRAMFTELKDFYTRLAATVPEVTQRNGRHAFLHRARVAREQENVDAFRDLRNELISYWEAYLEQEERKKDDMNRRLSRMLDVDVYPASLDEDHVCVAGPSSSGNAGYPTPSSSAQSPVLTTTAESWRHAARNTQLAASNSLYPRHRHRHRPQVQTQDQRTCPAAGSSAQTPVVIDLCCEPAHERQSHRLETQALPSPSSSSSINISPSTTTPPKDQAMALNPHPDHDPAPSQRSTKMVMQQEYQAMTQRQRNQARMQASFAQMSAGMMEQQESQGRIEEGVWAEYAEEGEVRGRYEDQGRERCREEYGVQGGAGAGSFEQAFSFGVVSSRKRDFESEHEQEEADEGQEIHDGKRQRVDSGMGWSVDGENYQNGDGVPGGEEHQQGERDCKESGDDGMPVEYAYAGEWDAGTGIGGVWAYDGQSKGKGKGKARMEEPEVLWCG